MSGHYFHRPDSNVPFRDIVYSVCVCDRLPQDVSDLFVLVCFDYGKVHIFIGISNWES